MQPLNLPSGVRLIVLRTPTAAREKREIPVLPPRVTSGEWRQLPPRLYRCAHRLRSDGRGLPCRRPRPPPPPALAPRQERWSERGRLLLPSQRHRDRSKLAVVRVRGGGKALLLLPAAGPLAATLVKEAEGWQMVAAELGRGAANRREGRSGPSRCPRTGRGEGRQRKGGGVQRDRAAGRCPV